MNYGDLLPLASIEAVRPVFMIVMGLFLMVVAIRLSKSTGTWTARLLVSGALLLGFGYTVMVPLYEARILENYSSRTAYQGSPATAFAWHCVKQAVMNSGWLLFAIGVALHAKVFSPAAPRRKSVVPLNSPHESVA